MNINEDKKVEVLISALEERYKAIHEIRSRLQNISVWILGILLATSGWLFQSDVYFFRHEQVILTTALLIVVAVLFKTYIKDLETGFKQQQIVAASLEAELGFYSDGVLTPKALFPQSWMKAGTKEGNGKYFTTTSILIITGVTLLILTIFIKGDSLL